MKEQQFPDDEIRLFAGQCGWRERGADGADVQNAEEMVVVRGENWTSTGLR